MRTIEIIGGGLAGLALGIGLRRRGVPVVVIEAGGYPRHRVCGEFIAGLSADTRQSLGIEELFADAVPHRTVTWFQNGSAVRTQTLPAPALGLSRYALDARLAEKFAALGGTLRANTRTLLNSPAPGKVYATGRCRAQSDWLGLKAHVAGRHGPQLSRAQSKDALGPPSAGGVAQRMGTMRSTLPAVASSGLEVHLGDDAYVGLSAIEGDHWNLCGFFRRRALPSGASLSSPAFDADHASPRGPATLLAYLRTSGLSALADRVDGYLDPGSFCAVAGLQIDRSVRRDGRMAVGDACAMTPPFTGNGMAMAFQSAELAASPLATYAGGRLSWDAAVSAVRRALTRRFNLRLSSASLIHPYLLEPPRQRWLARAARAHVLPLRPLYAILH